MMMQALRSARKTAAYADDLDSHGVYASQTGQQGLPLHVAYLTMMNGHLC